MLDNEMSPCPKRSTPPPMILEEHHGDDSEGEEQAERSREERMHKSPTLSQPRELIPHAQRRKRTFLPACIHVIITQMDGIQRV